MLHCPLTWEDRFLDSRFRGNDECLGAMNRAATRKNLPLSGIPPPCRSGGTIGGLHPGSVEPVHLGGWLGARRLLIRRQPESGQVGLFSLVENLPNRDDLEMRVVTVP